MRAIGTLIKGLFGAIFVLALILLGVGALKDGANQPPQVAAIQPAQDARVIPVADAEPAQTASRGPPLQEQMIAIIEEYKARAAGAANEMAQGAIRAERGNKLCTTFKALKGKVSGWIGTVADLGSTSSGKGTMAIRISDDIKLMTAVIDLFDADSPTLIPLNSALFKKAVALHEGDAVTFRGHFFPDKIDCLRELSLTRDGGMSEPDFLFAFEDVAKMPP